MSVALVWLRQDLRCFDNAALALASRSHQDIIVVYLFDEETRRKGAAQKWWLYHSLRDLSQALLAFGLPISFRSGDALTELSRLVREFRVDAVYWNRCYEP
ncbi:MAG: deoxyribodipyrimidine photolyase, partial [Legionella sp. 21-45-4]